MRRHADAAADDTATTTDVNECLLATIKDEKTTMTTTTRYNMKMETLEIVFDAYHFTLCKHIAFYLQCNLHLLLFSADKFHSGIFCACLLFCVV